MACCGRGRRERLQATSPQVAAQQEAERQAQKNADDLALSQVVKVAAEQAVAAYPEPDAEDAAIERATRKRRVRVSRDVDDE
jgi:hypothetical protein